MDKCWLLRCRLLNASTLNLFASSVRIISFFNQRNCYYLSHHHRHSASSNRTIIHENSTTDLSIQHRFYSYLPTKTHKRPVEKKLIDVRRPREELAELAMRQKAFTELLSNDIDKSIALLHRLVFELNDRHAIRFVLPTENEREKLEKVADPLHKLLALQVHVDDIMRIFVAVPQLLKTVVAQCAQWWSIMDKLVNVVGVEPTIAMELFAGLVLECSEQMLNAGADAMQLRLDAICSIGLATFDGGSRRSRMLTKIITDCPMLLTDTDPEILQQFIDVISDFFGRSNAIQALLKCPQMLLLHVDDVETKFEYIHDVMCLEPEDFVDCRQWSTRPYDEIKLRDQFLRRTGVYQLPDEKRPQLKKDNPSLAQILDTDDRQFATKIARVTMEEFVVFQELFAREQTQIDDDDPFRRLKRTHRKQMARDQLKQQKSERSSRLNVDNGYEFVEQPDNLRIE